MNTFWLGFVFALAGGAILVRSLWNKKRRTLGGGLLVGGFALMFWATRDPETRRKLAAQLVQWSLAGGASAMAARVVAAVARALSVQVDLSPAALNAARALASSGGGGVQVGGAVPGQTQPGQTQPMPDALPAEDLDALPPPTDEGDEDAPAAEPDIILIDPATVGRSSGEIPPALQWLDPVSEDDKRKAATLQAQTWRLVPPELRPGFSSPTPKLGARWLSAALGGMTPALAARMVAQDWAADDYDKAKTALSPYMDPQGKITFDLLGNVVTFTLA